VPPAASRLPVTPGERAYQWQDRTVDPSVAAWRQPRQQFRDHRLPFYKLPPNLEYTDPVTKGPGQDHAEAIEWFTVPYHEWERRVWVMRQRNQHASLYVAVLDSAVTQILKTQGNTATRDLLIEEIDQVRLMENDERIRNYATTKLAEVDAAIIAQMKSSAEEAMAAGKYEKAKEAFRKLLSEYSDDETRKYCTNGIDGIALAYRTEADKSFDMRNIRFQNESADAYQKLLESGTTDPLNYSIGGVPTIIGTKGDRMVRVQYDLSPLSISHWH